MNVDAIILIYTAFILIYTAFILIYTAFAGASMHAAHLLKCFVFEFWPVENKAKRFSR